VNASHWQERAAAIAGNAGERKIWAARLAGKLAADGHTSETKSTKLRTALRQTTLPRLNVAVLNAIEDDIRTVMREVEQAGAGAWEAWYGEQPADPTAAILWVDARLPDRRVEIERMLHEVDPQRLPFVTVLDILNTTQLLHPSVFRHRFATRFLSTCRDQRQRALVLRRVA